MLRLSFGRIVDAHRTLTIKLEGKLLAAWVDEVTKVCADGTDPSSRIRLDLSALVFVDSAGERLLREFIDRGIEIVACSSYVAELLRSNNAGKRPLRIE